MNKLLIVLRLFCISEMASCFLLRKSPLHVLQPAWALLPLLEATEGTPTMDGKDFPYCVSVSNTCDSWINEAVRHVRDHGVCVLVPTSSEEEPLIDSQDCGATNEAAASRLEELKTHIGRRGMDPDGQDGPFRFMEVVSRDELGGRYDMPVSWKNKQDLGMPLTHGESQGITNFHECIETIVQPVIDTLWTDDKSHVAASGFLINQPGTSNQNWHRDGPNEGLINVFCPLVDLTFEMGPTEIWSNTHLCASPSDERSNKMAPLLKRGQILLMDYRTFHRGLGNSSKDKVRTLAYVVYHKGASSLGDKLSYGLLPRAYQPIKATEFNAQEVFPFSVTVSRANDEWIQDAAFLLKQNGICVLSGAGDSVMCQHVDEAASSRLSELQRRIANRGVDPTGDEGPFHFLEISCPDDGGRLLDIPLSWKTRQDIGMPLSATESDVIGKFHTRVEAIVQPIVNELWKDESHHVASCGFHINKPRSPHRQWHREGCDEGSISVFCPLVDVTKDIGLTEVWPKSHSPLESSEEELNKMAPLLKRGQILLIDRRTLRQCLGNASRDATWTLAYAVFQKGSPNALDDRGHHLPGALTLAYD